MIKFTHFVLFFSKTTMLCAGEDKKKKKFMLNKVQNDKRKEKSNLIRILYGITNENKVFILSVLVRNKEQSYFSFQTNKYLHYRL